MDVQGEQAETAARPTPRAEGPDFVGVGAQKSGTTWVADVLRQHPEVHLDEKEISFFVQHFHRGYGWYHRFFAEKDGRMAGEITVSYLIAPRPQSSRKEFYPRWNPRRTLLFWRRAPSARDELAARYPGLRVFVVLRDPADRAWSHYWFWRQRKERCGGRVVPFERMFADDGRWIRTYGLYADHVTYWREAFPDLGLFFFDDLEQDPLGLARAIYRFVGVDPAFRPEVAKKPNKGRYAPMPRETRASLVESYREQIERLAAMTGRDLGRWLER